MSTPAPAPARATPGRQLTETVIVLGVNHRGVGAELAVDGNDYWEMPMGSVEVNSELRSRLLAASTLFRLDSEAGRLEHSLEVQVPFIQYASPGSRILPITVAAQPPGRSAGRRRGDRRAVPATTPV